MNKLVRSIRRLVILEHMQCSRYHSLTLLLVLLLALSACSNSPMLLRMAYQRFPSHISTELSSFANFNHQQIDWIENASTHHHNWHRTTQLPLYVNMLDSLSKQVQSDKTLNLAYFDSFIKQSRQLLVQINQCNPARFATTEMMKLSDQQVDQIRQNLQRKVDKSRDKYISETRDQRSNKRFRKMKKYLYYAKLNLNGLQQALLMQTIENQVSFGLRRFELTERWNMEFVYILEGRKRAGFTEKVQVHIGKLWRLIESEEAEIWSDTHNNWRNFAASLMESLTDQQRNEFGAWLSQMGRTLNTLANEKVRTVSSPSPLSMTCSALA